ncbi:g1383 [Coccomyxa elongata]
MTPRNDWHEETRPAEWVSEAEAVLADLPADLGDAKVADLQRVCVALRVSKTGKKQVLIDRINEVLDQYMSQQEARQEGEATGEDGSSMNEAGSGDEDAETEFPVGDAEEADFLGDLEEGDRLEKSMLDLRWRSEKEQMAELEKWTVRDMRTVLARQGIRIGVNTRANLISKVLIMLQEDAEAAEAAEAFEIQFTDEQDLQAKLNSRMIVELKEMLRKRQQQVKGTKTDLIERLTPLLLREAAIADYISNLRVDDVAVMLEARGLATDMDEATARASLLQALLGDDEDPQLMERLERERDQLAAEESRARWARFLGPYLRVAVICGGTGPGREASLLSARTLLDQLDTIHHLEAAAFDGVEMDPEQYGINVVPYYIDANMKPHVLSVEQLHSHSAADLDFLLTHTEQGIPSLEEVAEQLKVVADVAVPLVTGEWAERGELQALLQEAGVPFVGGPSEAVTLAASRTRLSGHMQQLGFPTLPQLEITAADFPSEDVTELADEWAQALELQKAQRDEELLKSLSPPEDGPVIHNPFARSTTTDVSSTESEASTSVVGGGDQQEAVIGVEAETAALAQPWGRRLWEWAQAAGLDAAGGFYVAKPSAVGRGGQPGDNVIMARGLPAIALAARKLLSQGHESVVVERHMGKAVRVSVAVVQGEQGPIALVPSQEEVICPEAVFLDAGLASEREAARREGYSEAQIDVAMAGQREALLQDTHGLSYAQVLQEDLPDTRLRQVCPPRLPRELVWGLRLAAARLFKELGLRDAAVIDGWVELPEEEEQLTSSSGQVMHTEERAPPTALPSLHHRLYPRSKAQLTPADLQKAARVHEDRDPSFDMQGEYLSDGTEGYKRIFDEAEAKLRWQEAMLTKPPAEVDDPCQLAPDALCSWESGNIMFDSVHAALDLRPTGALFAQAAEAGLSHQATLRHVVSSAARRADLPTIPTPFAESMHRTIFMKLPPPRDYHGEIDAMLEEEQIFTEDGRFNEALLARPGPENKRPRTGKPADPDAPFVPIWAHPKYGDRVDVGLVRQVEEAVKAQEEASGSGRQDADDSTIMPQRVWILMGGDSSERSASLASGLAAWLRLKTQSEVTAELFMLAPRNAGADLAERRATLLKRRSDLLAMVGTEEDLPENLQIQNIRRPSLRPVEPEVQGVWGVPYAAALHDSVEDIHEVCERLLAVANTVEHNWKEEDVDAAELRLYVQQQLVTADVPGVAATWGGDPNELAPPPRYMDLENFAMEAQAAQAVVLLALHGGIGENGYVQAFLQGYRVPFTGPGWDAASVAIDKAATAEVLAELEVHNISTAPKFLVSLQRLLSAAEDEEECQQLFEQMRDAFGGCDSMVIKPARDGGPAAVARLGNYMDLGWYARALAEREAAIPARVLSQPLSQQAAGSPIPLPLEPPPRFVAEPFVDIASVRMVEGEDGRPGVEWTGDSRWLQVSIGLLGQAGAMRALGPTLKLPGQGGATVRVTPPPEGLVRGDVLAGVRARAEMVADALGLNGVALLDALMHAETADLVLIEANAIPDLSPSSDLYQQAMLDEELGSPTPAELLKEVIAFSNFHDEPQPAAQDGAPESGADNGWKYGAMASLEDFEDEESLSMASADQ